MATLPSFYDATAVRKLDKTTYRVDLAESFSNGTVPNGGYVASTLMSAASTHLSSRGQPDIITAHFEFISRTEVGPAIIIVEEVKLGRRLSTLHVSLHQGNLTLTKSPWITKSSSRKEVVAYFNLGHLPSETGLSLPTSYQLLHSNEVPTPPRPDFSALHTSGRDKNWARFHTQAPGFKFGGMERRALRNMEYYFPLDAHPDPKINTGNTQKGLWTDGKMITNGLSSSNSSGNSNGARNNKKSVIDIWLRLSDHSTRFTNTSLGYVADCWPYVVEAYRSSASSSSSPITSSTASEVPQDAILWFPTVALNLDVKKPLLTFPHPSNKSGRQEPAEGVEWLYMRVTSKQIRNGRLDMEAVILDETGELVAVGSHVNLVVGGERNLKKSRGGGEGPKL